jgi:4-amino-4-deoxy-L-arabinose transferase-like glycosyltransferase
MALVSALTVAGVDVLGCQLFSPRVAIIGGLLAAVYPFFVFLSGGPLTENVAALLYTLLRVSLTRFAAKPYVWQALLSGTIIGFAVLNRPQAFSLLPFIGLWAWIMIEGRRLRRASLTP